FVVSPKCLGIKPRPSSPPAYSVLHLAISYRSTSSSSYYRAQNKQTKMAPSKRMSLEEKRSTILKIYHSSKEVYTEKEIVALAAKAGVNANTIIDINQGLIDDNLVSKEKIGGSNYFWSFPSKKDRMAQLQHESILRNITSLQEKVKEATVQLADAKRGREDDDSGDRAKKMARTAELTKLKSAAVEELEKLKQNDPQALADLEHELELVKGAANRWTDNIFSCKDYLVKKRGMDKKESMKILGITDAFDCECCTILCCVLILCFGEIVLTRYILHFVDPEDKGSK
ncbi:hypothetical protein ACHAXN_011767, partial [Cyclotella atomus]